MRKILSLLLVLTLGLVFVGCGHTHEFGEWVVVKEATEAEEGLKEKTCSCGEKQTEVIAKLEHVHNFVNGECACGEKEELKLKRV